MWPLSAATVDALKVFARDYLKLSDDEINAFEVRGVKPARGALTSGKTVSEYEVEFARIGDRDAFRSHAIKLASFG